jgi:ADP-heptose:LPS heptosyltransferase
VAKKKNKIAYGFKYFWLNLLGREQQIRVLNFLNKTYSLRKTITFNRLVLDFKRVLVILPEKPYEVMMTQRCIVALKEHKPGMAVDVVAESVNKDIIKSNPFIDSGIFYSTTEYFYNHPAFKELITVIRDKSYDACFLMKGEVNPLDLLLAAMSMAPLRIGFAGGRVSPFINLSIRPKEGTLYEGDRYEALFKSLGVRMSRSKLKWDIPRATEKDVEGVLVEAGYKIKQPLIGLNISPSISDRMLSASTIESLIQELSRLGNAEIVLFCSSRKESGLLKELEGLEKKIVPIPGDQVSFAAAFIYKCDIIISLNNLIYQLAVMLNRPVIGLFEENEHARWALKQENKFEIVVAPRIRAIEAAEIMLKAAKMLSPGHPKGVPSNWVESAY